jgi:hypothetical protein
MKKVLFFTLVFALAFISTSIAAVDTGSDHEIDQAITIGMGEDVDQGFYTNVPVGNISYDRLLSALEKSGTHFVVADDDADHYKKTITFLGEENGFSKVEGVMYAFDEKGVNTRTALRYSATVEEPNRHLDMFLVISKTYQDLADKGKCVQKHHASSDVRDFYVFAVGDKEVLLECNKELQYTTWVFALTE